MTEPYLGIGTAGRLVAAGPSDARRDRSGRALLGPLDTVESDGEMPVRDGAVRQCYDLLRGAAQLLTRSELAPLAAVSVFADVRHDGNERTRQIGRKNR